MSKDTQWNAEFQQLPQSDETNPCDSSNVNRSTSFFHILVYCKLVDNKC